MDPRTGIGYDIHRLGANRPLLLGGVQVPCESGLQGHSDADVVLHALTDALLGALGAPDIGDLFPDTDPTWAGADSTRFLVEADRRRGESGYKVANVDLVIHAERPKLAPHKNRIRERLAELLNVSHACVGVKATTNEGLDAVGRGEAIACWANVLLVPGRP